MKRVSARTHLPTPWIFEPCKRPDNRADYCLGNRVTGTAESSSVYHMLWLFSSKLLNRKLAPDKFFYKTRHQHMTTLPTADVKTDEQMANRWFLWTKTVNKWLPYKSVRGNDLGTTEWYTYLKEQYITNWDLRSDNETKTSSVEIKKSRITAS